MPKITIDGLDVNTEDLSANAKAQLASIQFIEAQMQKLKNDQAAYETALKSYLAAFQQLVD